MAIFTACHERIRALESLFRKKFFVNLVPTLIEFHEAMHYTKVAEKNNIDLFEIGRIPPLPEGYWSDDAPWDLNSQIILAACIVCFANKPPQPLLLNNWSNELQQVAEPTADFKKLINVLHGEVPDEHNLYEQGAAALLSLQNTSLMPAQLWKHSLRLLEAARMVKNITSTALEELLVKRWFFAAQQQKFAFIAPRISTVEIENACFETRYSGIEKVALILIVALPYLGIKISNEIKNLLENIRNGK